MVDALFFLAIFWFVPLHLVIAAITETIARQKNLASGDWFMRALLLGYPVLSEVAFASPTDEQHDQLFKSEYARRLLTFVLIMIGAPYLIVVFVILSYFLPDKQATPLMWIASFEMIAWAVGAFIAFPVAALKITERLKYKPTRALRAGAIAGQAITFIYYLGHLREVEDGLSEAECRILRSLVIPLAVPLAFVECVVSITILCIGGLGLALFLQGRISDFPWLIMIVSGAIGVICALLISPAVAYCMSIRRHRSPTMWVPFSFVIPALAPLALLLFRAEKSDRIDNFLSDSHAIIVTHALLASAALIAILTYVGWGLKDHWPIESAGFGFVLAWIASTTFVPLLTVPFAIRARRLITPENAAQLKPICRVFYLAALQSCMMATAITLLTIKLGLHNSKL